MLDWRGDQPFVQFMFRDYALVVVCYIAAIVAAAATLPFTADWHPLMRILVADVAATVAVFLFSFGSGNSSMYDPYWSIAPPIICAWLIFTAEEANTTRQVVVFILVLAWSIRLTGNWAYGWRGLAHEDWRYVDLKAATGIFWWPVSLLGIHLFPTLVVFLGCISLWPAVATGGNGPGYIDAIALIIGASSIWLEYAADRQLHRFRQTREDMSAVLQTGVWRHCRHPNYVGEIGFWISLLVFAFAAIDDPGARLLASAGPLAMIALFVGISIPMIEKRLLANKPAYAGYAARTGALLPRL